jgi:hypothetical protein
MTVFLGVGYPENFHPGDSFAPGISLA